MLRALGLKAVDNLSAVFAAVVGLLPLTLLSLAAVTGVTILTSASNLGLALFDTKALGPY
jgi:hypothetical protein